MSDGSDPGQGARPSQSGAFGRALGLGAGETAVLTDLVADGLDALGLDGGRIAARLADGVPLAAALGLPAGTADLLYARAYNWASTGRWDRAEPLFRALCLIDGADAENWTGYGLALREREAFPEALDAFAVAVRLRPDWPVPHFHAFETAARAGRWDVADRHRAGFDRTAPSGLPPGMAEAAVRLKLAVDRHRAGRQDGPR